MPGLVSDFGENMIYLCDAFLGNLRIETARQFRLWWRFRACPFLAIDRFEAELMYKLDIHSSFVWGLVVPFLRCMPSKKHLWYCTGTRTTPCCASLTRSSCRRSPSLCEVCGAVP